MMPSSLGFCCLYSCPCLLPSGYLSLCLVPPVSLCVSIPGRPVLSGRNLDMENYGTGSAPGFRMKPKGSCPQLFLSSYILMALCSPSVQEFEQKWWSYLCSHLCQHSWETSSFLTALVYGVCCGTGSASYLVLQISNYWFSIYFYLI